jgi:hypothetical protein
MSESPFGDFVSYSDESCITGHKFMVIGGVLCRDDTAKSLLRELDSIHPNRPGHWSYEWKYIRPTNLQRYERFIDLFFEYNKEHKIDFSCVVIECAELDHATFNEGDGEKGFNKFMFQHLFRHYRALRGISRFRCYHDRRESLYDLADIRNMLNAKCFQQDGRLVTRYRELAYADKLERPMLQFADVLIGAVGFAWNRKAGSKNEIAERVRLNACLDSLAEPTPPGLKNFDIWKFELSRPREPSAL